MSVSRLLAVYVTKYQQQEQQKGLKKYNDQSSYSHNGLYVPHLLRKGYDSSFAGDVAHGTKCLHHRSADDMSRLEGGRSFPLIGPKPLLDR